MKIKKDKFLEELKSNTYFLSFDSNGDNYYFVNFKNLLELNEFIKKEGLLNLYNQWLDFICSDHIAKTVEHYFIGKVLTIEEEHYTTEIIERNVVL